MKDKLGCLPWRKRSLVVGSKQQWIVAGNILVLLFMGILHSLEAGHYVDFYPINGTFQDYNPIRRLLSGQIPYKEFIDYLGLGHLYIGAFFTGLFGADYRASLIAFRLIAFLSTALFFYVIAKSVLKSSSFSIFLTNLLLVILLTQPTFLETIVGDEKIQNALEQAMKTGNSARILRGAILPISIFIIQLFSPRVINLTKKKTIKINREILFCICAGVLAGFCFPWSNDYGISSWLCMLLMTLFVAFARTKNIYKSLIGFIISFFSSVVSCFLVVEILTVGHFTEWVSATFGTGGYQSWYYLSEKSYYITDVDFSYIMLVQAFIGLVYLTKVWKANGCFDSIIRYGLLAYANLTCFCAVNEYKLLSGSNMREVALIVLFSTVIVEIMNCACVSGIREKAILTVSIASFVTCMAWIVSSCQAEMKFQFFDEKQGVYVEAMGGYMTGLGEDILETAEFLGDKKTFATYASAQELVSGNFQPSGIDYLIHVLGDKQRESYLESFKNDDFEYAVTINENFSNWEFWLVRANWFFYRNLFENWHPVYANTYEVYWERNTGDEATVYTGDADVSIETNANSRSVKIVVKTDESISGVADVFVDYEAQKDDGIASFLVFNMMVSERNSGESFTMNNESGYDSTNLRSSGKEYIPVSIVNGYGEVILIAQPEKNVVLSVNEASCSGIYTVQHRYVKVNEIINYEACTVFCVDQSKRAIKILEDISYIYINGEKVKIHSISDGIIVIENVDIEGIGEVNNLILKSNNMFRVE